MPSSSSASSSRVLSLAFFAVAVISIASCGSRTGLFGVGPGPDDSGGSGNGSLDAGPDGPTPCVPGKFDFELATAQLMFVLDRSGSMAFSIAGLDPVPPGQLSRWETLREALSQTILGFDQQLAMGAKFFPEVIADQFAPADEACRVDTGVGIPPLRGNANDILSTFDTTEPRGGTPTSEAVRLAALYLADRRTLARTMILATDGAPNCNPDLEAKTCTCTTRANDCASVPDGEYSCLDDIRTVQVISDIFQNRKIPVFVIGIGGTERPDFLQVLDAMAVAGGRPRNGTPRHYNVQTAQEMKDAFASIRDSIAKCTYLTPSAPTDPNAITVEIDGKSIARDPSHQNGWDWVDQVFGELAFFGPACDAAGAVTASVKGTVTCTEH
jgi:hypothetical protein